MRTVNIQEYSDIFQNEIIDLILKIQIDEFNIPITINDQPDLKNIHAVYQNGTGNFWVATDENKIIGTIALIDIGNNQVALRKMFVEKAYRGVKIGVAQKLLEQLISWCKNKKIDEIYLGTTSAYHAAHRFYEKNHFSEIKKNELPKHFPIMEVDSKFYKYRVIQGV